jgi:hypothetical protein
MGSKQTKKKTARHLSRAEKRRRGRIYGLIFLGIPTLAFVFYLVDYSGPREVLQGTVVETSSYTHSGGDRAGEHTHVAAVLEYEGSRYTLKPGDRFRRGDRISVEVRRGRITGHPYFVQAWR